MATSTLLPAGPRVPSAPVGFCLGSDDYRSVRECWACLQSITRLDAPRMERLRSIEALPPSLIRLPRSCKFHPRCPYVPPPACEIERQLSWRRPSPGASSAA